MTLPPNPRFPYGAITVTPYQTKDGRWGYLVRRDESIVDGGTGYASREEAYEAGEESAKELRP